jgi:hypothetical protein
MKTISAWLALSFLWLTGCNDSPPPAPSSSSSSGPNSYLGQAANASRRAEKTVDLAAVNKAISQFYVQEGRFPTNLTELALRDYLPIIPVLPVGMTWDYDTNTGVASVIKEAVKE